MPEWPPRVLVVDDERLVVETIAAALEEEYRVSTAATVPDAVHQLREAEFAVVLLDCLLPDGDIGEVIAAAEARDAAVILMSGDPTQNRNLLGGWPALPRQAVQHRAAIQNVASAAHLNRAAGKREPHKLREW